MSMNQGKGCDPECVEKQKEIWKNMEMLDGILSSLDSTIETLRDRLSPVLKPKKEETPAINKETSTLADCWTLLGSKLRTHYSCLDILQLSLEDLINRLEI